MSDDAPPNDPLAEGVRLFNEGYFFEAHEILEDAWHIERGEPRRFLQGLIQVCAGCHHWSNANATGAMSLFNKALDKFRGYPAEYLGINLDDLRAKVEDWRDRAERGEHLETPRIRLGGRGARDEEPGRPS